MSSAYGCQGGVLRSAPTWLGIAATLLIVLLMAAEVNGAVAYGVLFATVIAWIPGCAFAIAGAMDQFIPGFVKQPGFEFPRRMAALVSDGLACIPGALMGTSPVIVMAESSVAVEQGGRTGLTPLLTGGMFLLAMFFAPLFSNIPPYATGPALIVVGCLMVSTVRFINWENIQEAFPAFVTIAVMPFTYSISNGLLAGIAATFALWVLDIGSALLQSVLKRSDPDIKPPGRVLSEHFDTWRAAFGDLTWVGYKSEVMATFERARSLRVSSSLRRMGSSMSWLRSGSLREVRGSSICESHGSAAPHGSIRAPLDSIPEPQVLTDLEAGCSKEVSPFQQCQYTKQ